MTAHAERALVRRCLEGEASALAELETGFLAPVEAALCRKFNAEVAREALQRLRLQLLVRDESGHCGLVEYRATGSLAGWLRIIAMRLAFEVVQSGRLPADAEPEDVRRLTAGALELESLAHRYGPHFEKALSQALAELSQRDRLAFKLSFVDGVPLRKVGQLFKVNASTVSRWLVSARSQLQARAYAVLESELDLPASSVRRLVDRLAGAWEGSLRKLL